MISEKQFSIHYNTQVFLFVNCFKLVYVLVKFYGICFTWIVFPYEIFYICLHWMCSSSVQSDNILLISFFRFVFSSMIAKKWCLECISSFHDIQILKMTLYYMLMILINLHMKSTCANVYKVIVLNILSRTSEELAQNSVHDVLDGFSFSITILPDSLRESRWKKMYRW